MAQDVVVTMTSLEDFITRALSPNVPEQRSLTMVIDINQLPPVYPNQPASQEHDASHDSECSPSANRLWRQLQRLADELLPHLSSLASFSLVVVSKGRNGFWIPRPLIVTLLDALPRSCHSVEIDTQGQDRCEPGSGHLCDTFRALLPRLRHVRLRLSTMCDFLFGSRQELQLPQAIESSLDPQTAPALETVLINCTGKSVRNQARLCGSYQEDVYQSQYLQGRDAAPVLAACMQSFVACCPQLKKMSLIDIRQGDYDDRSVYPSFNRRNILQDKILCMPFAWVPLESDGLVMRTLDRGDVLSSHKGFQALTEEQMWQQTSEGYRLPADMFTARGYEPKEIPVLGAEAWKEKHPGKSCALWWNEKQTGQRLLEAVEKTGVTEEVVLREATPEGWMREGGDLFPAEE